MTSQAPSSNQLANEPTARPSDSPELLAIKQLLALLEKTFKTTRTYGPNNPVALKFFQQFFSFLTIQLAAHDVLQFLVQRSELYYKGEVVYQSSSGTENLAFKLHADGIRELSFHKGLTQDDLLYFLSALWNTYDPDVTDDDIVTRLWERNLSTISFVTAEEIVTSIEASSILTPQDATTFNAPASHLQTISSTEASRQKVDPGSGGPGQGGGVAGYETSPEEMQRLMLEMETESSRDHVTYLLDMLTAILASERSAVLLTRVIDLFGDILDTLIQEGNWKLLNTFVSLLHEAQELCPNLSDVHKQHLSALFDSLAQPDRLKAIETVLNASPGGSLDDLHALFSMLHPDVSQSLCTLMSNLKHKSHRLMVCDVLMAHAKHNPQVLTIGLSDPRWFVVRNLVYIIGKVGNERLLRPIEALIHHPDVRVRKEVLKALKNLAPSGRCDRFLSFLNDSEATIRALALRIIASGSYTASFAAWAGVVTHDAFLDRPAAEKRSVFQAMRQTAGEQCVPYWHALITRRFWRKRRQHQEAAVLAAEALAAVRSPAAMVALRDGQRRFNRAIRQACTIAVQAAPKHTSET